MQRIPMLAFTFMVCADAAVLRNATSQGGLKGMFLKRKSGPYGLSTCPCVGIDKLEGHTMATIDTKTGKQVPYPADMGARCKAWDADHHPECPGASWCSQKWCYVDPCNCDKLSPYPKPASYLPDAKYQGKPAHFSYATCDGTDSYSEAGAGSSYDAIEKTCAVDVDSAKWGHEDCRCVGLSPQPGTMKVNIDGKKVDFPADTGAQCKTWEKDNHPECKGSSPPSWCNQAWCYVDPCKCKSAVPPKTSSYVPEAKYQGKPVYYSYATCGGTDSWTASKHDAACVNQKDKDACSKLSKCAWNGKECLGAELVEVCSGAFGLKAIVVLGLSFLSLV